MRTNKNITIPGLLIVITMLVSGTLKAQSNDVTIPLSNPSERGKLRVNVNSGSITVKATSRKDVLLRYKEEDNGAGKATKKENTDSNRAGLKRIAGSGLDLEITEHQNSVTVESGSWSHRLSIELEIPSGFDVFLHTYNNGFLMVTGVQGKVELENFNGKITALNISGSVVASTYNGDIKVTFDKVTPNTPMSYSTFNGDIELSLPGDYKTTIKGKTEQGSIYSDFDIQFKNTGPLQKKEKKGDVFRVVIDDWKVGDINGGGPELTMQNYNGDLIIRKK
ncbi:MAG TPA: DUF4097 family beta strand repeat-containing protein [Ohtaekwangia sp.]|nr:DUF4097 family beta strand repeat-containing protein [Ohtaekwangia sp.]